MADMITSLKLNEQSLSNGGELLLVSIREAKRYAEGKPTDEIEWKVCVVAVKNGFNKYEVTVTEKPTFNVTEENPIPVSFVDLKVSLYRKFNDSQGYGLSCKAKAVMPVKKQ